MRGAPGPTTPHSRQRRRPLMLPVQHHLSAAGRILHLLGICSSPSQLLQLQAQTFVHGLHRCTWVASAFITSCKDLRLLSLAILFFRHVPGKPHVYLCNRVLSALVHPPSSSSSESFSLVYIQMLRDSIRPNNYTFPLVLKAFSDLRLLEPGRCVHAHVLMTGHASDIYVQNSMLNLYSSCGDIEMCEQLFDEMRLKDAVSWTTLIEGYRKMRRLDDALIAFERMQFSGVEPNQVSAVNALAACAMHGAIDMGAWIHNFVTKKGWNLDMVLGTALIDMYGKCGRIEDGLDVFSGMAEKSVYTWNSLIHGLALAKSGEAALELFSRMQDEGVKADAVTLIGVLCACSHSGLVEAGRGIFRQLLKGSYGLLPNVKHYGCMVYLLGRAGFLEEAVELVGSMPFAPNVVVYGSLLSACRAAAAAAGTTPHGKLKCWSEDAARKLVELEPENGAHYIILCNMYASMGRWIEAEKVRTNMVERRQKREDSPWLARSFVV